MKIEKTKNLILEKRDYLCEINKIERPKVQLNQNNYSVSTNEGADERKAFPSCYKRQYNDWHLV